MKETRGPRTVRVPSPPDSMAVPLPANHEPIERGVIEVERAAVPQRLDRLHEDEVGRARAVTRRSHVGQHEEFARDKVRRRLEPDRGDSISGILSTAGHFCDLLKDELIQSSHRRDVLRGGRRDRSQQKERREPTRDSAFQSVESTAQRGNCRSFARRDPCVRNGNAEAAFHQDEWRGQ